MAEVNSPSQWELHAVCTMKLWSEDQGSWSWTCLMPQFSDLLWSACPVPSSRSLHWFERSFSLYCVTKFKKRSEIAYSIRTNSWLKKANKWYYASGAKFLRFPSALFNGGFPFFALSKSVFNSFIKPYQKEPKKTKDQLSMTQETPQGPHIFCIPDIETIRRILYCLI